MSQPAAEFHFSPRPNRAAEIHWRPWSAEAFEEARALDRPILLSISAVWCHWCHVMDETTYSDPGVIATVNARYLPIRVDNDARPDVNQRYNMGGWPTTALLTPAGDILTGATYLPPAELASALDRVADYYHANRVEIASQVLEGRHRAALVTASQVGTPEPELVDRLLQAAIDAYDPEHGGFGEAPKFPQADAIALLAEQAVLRQRPDLGEMALHSLSAMAEGGTYDHVEGGFFRYSTTRDWSVPHFEKMLEDHAGLLAALALTGQAGILDSAAGYLDAVLRDPATGLYAGSQDADEEYFALDAAGRATRPAPYVDRRVYADWNCALAVAFLAADRRLGRPTLRERAAGLLEALFAARFDPQRGLDHLEGMGGLLGDQAWGLLAAVRAAGAGLGPAWLDRARALAAVLDRDLADPRLGGYLDHRPGPGDLGRLEQAAKPLAANCVAAIGLDELDILLGDPAAGHHRRAGGALESVAGLGRQSGVMGAVLARALDRHLRPAVKVTTLDQELARAALAAYPYAVIETAGDGRAVVCVGTTCLAPIEDAAALAAAVRGA